MIMEGNVFVENQREDKAGATFDTEAEITVKGNTLKYVIHTLFFTQMDRKASCCLCQKCNFYIALLIIITV